MASEEQGEVLFFDQEGWCWGVTPNSKTVCCGRTEAVKDMLANPNKRTGNEVVDGIIELERQLKQEKERENGRTATPIRKSLTARRANRSERSRLVRGSKSEGRHSRVSAPGKRIPIR